MGDHPIANMIGPPSRNDTRSVCSSRCAVSHRPAKVAPTAAPPPQSAFSNP